MRKRLGVYIATFILVGCTICLLLYQSVLEEASLFSAMVFADGQTETVQYWRSEDDTYYLFLPGYTEMDKVQIQLNTERKVSINGVQLSDGMLCDSFQPDTAYDFSFSSWKGDQIKKIIFVKSGGVSTMHIDTQSGNMEYIHGQKGNEESGTIRVYGSDGTVNYSGQFTSLKGRGNSTWEVFTKKPYNLKLSEDVDLLGMGSAQKWVLLANAVDPSNMRNKVALDFAEQAGIMFSPDSEWVDLYLNGEYAGLYLLCEQIEVHKERVNIPQHNSLLVSQELKSRLVSQNYPHLVTEADQALRIHHAFADSDVAVAVWQSVENAILAEDGIDPLTRKSWDELIDPDSWARKYLIEEIFGNLDAGYLSQYYFYSGDEGLMYAGPVWDFDYSMGMSWQLSNPKQLIANRLYVKENIKTPWIWSLMQKPQFCDRVTELYQMEIKPLMAELLDQGLPHYLETITPASDMNQLRWFQESEKGSVEVDKIHSYLAARIDFLNSLWITGQEYCIVRAENNRNMNLMYYAVEPGGSMPELPIFEDETFLGWYYGKNGQPVDMDRPIYEDTEIYAKWSIPVTANYAHILAPIGLITVFFFCVLTASIVRIRKDGWQYE